MASPPGDPSTAAAGLASLHAEFPGYRIWHEITGDRARLVAVRRHHGTSPHTVVTADPAELRAALGASLPPLRPQSLTSGPADASGEYPQAIADDYPGWHVRHHHDGQWTAWCPAITVHAATAPTIRAAIEQAITGNNDHL
jgi:hypothetical protein